MGVFLNAFQFLSTGARRVYGALLFYSFKCLENSWGNLARLTNGKNGSLDKKVSNSQQSARLRPNTSMLGPIAKELASRPKRISNAKQAQLLLDAGAGTEENAQEQEAEQQPVVEPLA